MPPKAWSKQRLLCSCWVSPCKTGILSHARQQAVSLEFLGHATYPYAIDIRNLIAAEAGLELDMLRLLLWVHVAAD